MVFHEQYIIVCQCASDQAGRFTKSPEDPIGRFVPKVWPSSLNPDDRSCEAIWAREQCQVFPQACVQRWSGSSPFRLLLDVVLPFLLVCQMV